MLHQRCSLTANLHPAIWLACTHPCISHKNLSSLTRSFSPRLRNSRNAKGRGWRARLGACTGTLIGDDEGVKFFVIYGVPVVYYGRASEIMRIRARVFDVKRTGVYTCKYTGVRTSVYANFFLRGTVYMVITTLLCNMKTRSHREDSHTRTARALTSKFLPEIQWRYQGLHLIDGCLRERRVPVAFATKWSLKKHQ